MKIKIPRDRDNGDVTQNLRHIMLGSCRTVNLQVIAVVTRVFADGSKGLVDEISLLHTLRALVGLNCP